MYKDVNVHVKQCIKCRPQNLHPQHYVQLHLEVPMMPMQFTAMGLIGKFKTLSQGHQFTLTIIDMLTYYTWCLLLFIKADKVGHEYLVNGYSKFDGSHKIMSDSGMEFKNKLFTQVVSTLGMKQVFSSPHYP